MLSLYPNSYFTSRHSKLMAENSDASKCWIQGRLVCRAILKGNRLARTNNTALNIHIFTYIFHRVPRFTNAGYEIFCTGNIPV